MATLRKNANWILPLSVVLLIVAGWWLLRSGVPRAEAAAAAAARFQEGYTRLDPASAAQMDILRREAGLDDDILGAMNLGSEGTLEVLASARGWFEANAGQLQTRRTALADQRSIVQHLKSRNDMGEDVLGEYRAARTQLAQLETDHAAYVAGCRSAVLARVTDEQRNLAERMFTQRGLPMPYRALALSTDQQNALRKALIEYGQRRSNAADDEQRTSAREAFDRALAEAIGSGNITALATLRGALATSSSQVVAAINTVLPTDPVE